MSSISTIIYGNVLQVLKTSAKYGYVTMYCDTMSCYLTLSEFLKSIDNVYVVKGVD